MPGKLRFQTPEIAPDRGKEHIGLGPPWEDEGHGRRFALPRLAGVHLYPDRVLEAVPQALQYPRDRGAERIGSLRAEARVPRGGQADDGIGSSEAENDQFGEISSTRRSVSKGREPRILWTPFFRLKR